MQVSELSLLWAASGAAPSRPGLSCVDQLIYRLGFFCPTIMPLIMLAESASEKGPDPGRMTVTNPLRGHMDFSVQERVWRAGERP